MPRPRGPPPARKSKAAVKPRASAPRRGAVKGKGFYKGFAADLGYGLGRVGNYFTGRNDLHEKGRMLGQGFSNVTGLGAYKQNLNTLVQVVPEVMNARSKEGATIVRHKEYVCDVTGSSSFTIQQQLDINPGLNNVFPWVSQIANAYEEWELLGCLVEFVTTSGNATGSNTSLGEIMISSEYNSYNPPFANKQQMLNQIFAVSGVPSANLVHAIECQPKQNQVARFYVRNGPSSVPIVLTDLCRTTIATSGNQGTNALGEVWITYELALYKPRLAVGSSPNPPAPVKKTVTVSGVIDTAVATGGQNTWGFDLSSIPPLVVPQDFNYAANVEAMKSADFVTASISIDNLTNQGPNCIIQFGLNQTDSPTYWASTPSQNPTGDSAPTYYATHPTGNPLGNASWDLRIGNEITFNNPTQGLGVARTGSLTAAPVATNIYYSLSFDYYT